MNFKNITVLAPMAGATDSSMRRLCRSLGADFSVSEMVSAKAMCYNDKKTGLLTRITKGEGPVAVQLFGHEPEIMANAAAMIAEADFEGCSFDEMPVSIDINMGCPVKKIVSANDGCALMRNPRLAGKIVFECVKALEKYGIPLTVKIRSGWDKDSINAPEFAKMLEANGAVAVAVHARTREQMYSSFADVSVIADVKRAVGIPVIGNGDIRCADDAFKMTDESGCDSVMIGRAALGNPWIFSQIKALARGDTFTPPDRDEIISTALRLVKSIIEEKGEYVGIREARGRAAYFIKGLRGSAAMRDKINRAETYGEIEKILQSD